MNDRSRQNMLDALDALVEAINYIEQDQDYVVVHKGDVEIRVDSTRWNKMVLKPHEEEGAK